MTKEEARSVIEKDAGRHFNPVVMQAFFKAGEFIYDNVL